MSVRAYHLRREVYRKRSGAVSNPGDTRGNAKERRFIKRELEAIQKERIAAETILKEQTNG